MLGKGWRNRKEAAQFLTDLGYPCTAKHLEHLAVRKKGPPYTKTGWRLVHYQENDLRQWAEANIERVPA